jgi:hypothetical protein
MSQDDDLPLAMVIKLDDHRLSAKPEDPDAPKLPLRKHYDHTKPACYHRQTLVDNRNRTIECEHCHVLLDPIDVLWQLAHSSDWSYAKQEKLKLEKLCHQLTEEKKRLRAAVQKLRKEAGEKPWNEWDDMPRRT